MRQLQKLTKRSFLADTTYLPPEYKDVYDRLMCELAEVSQAHSRLEHRILRDCEEPLRTAPTSGEWSKLRRYDESLAPVLKEISSLENQLHKDQKKHDSKRTGTTRSKCEATQQALTRAVAQWDKRMLPAASAYERVDRARLGMLKDTVRRFARAQGDMAKELYEHARETGYAASEFDTERELSNFVQGTRLPARSHALASTAPPSRAQSPALDAAQSRSVSHAEWPMPESSSERAPSRGVYSRSAAAHMPHLRDEADGQGVPGRSSPRFSVPLPSALLHASHESHSPKDTSFHPERSPIPAQLTPARSVASLDGDGAPEPVKTPIYAPSIVTPGPLAFGRAPPADENAIKRNARRATTQLSDVPLPDTHDDEAAWEQMRTQLRNSSLGLSSPTSRRDRREYRNSSFNIIEGLNEAAAPEETVQSHGSTVMPAPAPALASAFSPATISTTQMSPVLHAVPISARIVERVNVMWAGGALARVMIVGEIRLSTLAATPASGSARILLTHAEQVEKVAGNPELLSEVVYEPNLYEVDLAQLAKLGKDTVALRYQVRVGADAYEQYAPILLEPQWRCEPQQSSLLLAYRANPRSLLFSRAPHAALHAVSFDVAIPAESHVTGGVLSQPVGDWDPEAQQLRWQREASLPLGDEALNKILARFPLASQGTPQPVSAAWQLAAHTVSDVGIEAYTGDQSVVLASVHRETVSGKYFSQP